MKPKFLKMIKKVIFHWSTYQTLTNSKKLWITTKSFFLLLDGIQVNKIRFRQIKKCFLNSCFQPSEELLLLFSQKTNHHANIIEEILPIQVLSTWILIKWNDNKEMLFHLLKHCISIDIKNYLNKNEWYQTSMLLIWFYSFFN